VSQGHHVRYVCTRETFRPAEHAQVRWLTWDDDFSLVQGYWKAGGHTLTRDQWLEARSLGYTYCAIVQDECIISLAAVWRYSEAAWEAAAVSTRQEYRRQGMAKAVISFVTEHILDEGRVATCTTGEGNLAMRRTAEAVGFVYSHSEG
jgi:RimJ/RimL family protein N-acetyltransferase